ncbi:DUF3568 family protein [Isosphaeraceae bacterium EP7]
MMGREIRRLGVMIALGGFAGSGLAGCRTMGGMAGKGAVQVAGSETETFPVPGVEVEKAAEQAMNDLAMTVKAGPRAEQKGQVHIWGRAKDARTVRVDVAGGAQSSAVTVVIGTYGDPPLSRALLDRIGVRLGTKPPQPIPDQVESEPAGNPFVNRAAVPDAVMLRDQSQATYRDAIVP